MTVLNSLRIGILAGAVAMLAACGDGGETSAPEVTKSEALSERKAETPVFLTIDWAGVAAQTAKPDTDQQGLLKKRGHTPDTLETVTFPVLVPGAEDPLKRLEIFAQPNLYAAIAHYPGYSIQVKGLRSKGDIDKDSWAVSEDRLEARLPRWGALYSVSITCTDNLAPCRDDAALQALVDSLIWIGPYSQM